MNMYLLRICTMLALLSGGLLATGLGPAVDPKARRAETKPASAASRTITVPAGADLQAALDRATPGDVIALAPGAVYAGSFTLPKKTGEGWIVVKTAAPDSDFPAPGRRVDPSQARLMPKLVANSGSVLTAAPGAHHYRFVGIEIAPKDGVSLRDLVDLGSRATTVESLPHHLAFERCYLHGDKAKGTRRGIALNARDVTIVDSYFADFKE